MRSWINNFTQNITNDKLTELRELFQSSYGGRDFVDEIQLFLKENNAYTLEQIKLIFFFDSFFDDDQRKRYICRSADDWNFSMQFCNAEIAKLFDAIEVARIKITDLVAHYYQETDPMNLSLQTKFVVFMLEALSPNIKLNPDEYSKDLVAINIMRYGSHNLGYILDRFYPDANSLDQQYIENFIEDQDLKNNPDLKQMEMLARAGGQVAALYLAGYSTVDWQKYEAADYAMLLEKHYTKENIICFLKQAASGPDDNLAKQAKGFLKIRFNITDSALAQVSLFRHQKENTTPSNDHPESYKPSK